MEYRISISKTNEVQAVSNGVRLGRADSTPFPFPSSTRGRHGAKICNTRGLDLPEPHLL